MELGIPEIIAIISLIISCFVGVHYTIKSKCWGFNVEIINNEPEINISNDNTGVEIV
jgi:hypothetical protein